MSCSSQGTESDAIYLGDNVPVTLSEPVSSTMKGSYLGMSCPGVCVVLVKEQKVMPSIWETMYQLH